MSRLLSCHKRACCWTLQGTTTSGTLRMIPAGSRGSGRLSPAVIGRGSGGTLDRSLVHHMTTQRHTGGSWSTQREPMNAEGERCAA
ncbi:hypothetical protein CHARACLAT_020783 [Characodon lateralis]|uniref:Uncharacterized protein n=1 Tax=Characodon lateralis TaxID=208331 RepID=A0ABU7DIE5_9TELE|nr:hypothetical protein [Characodon lateralis]